MLTIYIYGKFSENKTKLIYFLGNVISERDITVKNKAHSGEWAIFYFCYSVRPYDGGTTAHFASVPV